MVGDGEAETGPLATAWHSNKFLNLVTDGVVLPILHLNGYKIANHDAGLEPDVVMACAGDVPTLEALAAVSMLRSNLPELKIRVVNVVDLMKLQPEHEHPHGLSELVDHDPVIAGELPDLSGRVIQQAGQVLVGKHLGKRTSYDRLKVTCTIGHQGLKL